MTIILFITEAKGRTDQRIGEDHYVTRSIYGGREHIKNFPCNLLLVFDG